MRSETVGKTAMTLSAAAVACPLYVFVRWIVVWNLVARRVPPNRVFAEARTRFLAGIPEAWHSDVTLSFTLIGMTLVAMITAGIGLAALRGRWRWLAAVLAMSALVLLGFDVWTSM